MGTATVYERVAAMVVRIFHVEESQVIPKADWVQLKADPPEVEALFVALGKEFSIVISPEEASGLETVGAVVAYIIRAIAEVKTADV